MDDLISRQAAIDYLLDDLYDLEDTDCVDKEFIEEGLKRVPSVQPEQKTGEWVYGEFDIPHCSICGHDVMPNMVSPYCPNCGAKMEKIGGLQKQ